MKKLCKLCFNCKKVPLPGPPEKGVRVPRLLRCSKGRFDMTEPDSLPDIKDCPDGDFDEQELALFKSGRRVVKRKYINLKDVVPAELLAEVQKHVQGKTVYVPAPEDK